MHFYSLDTPCRSVEGVEDADSAQAGRVAIVDPEVPHDDDKTCSEPRYSAFRGWHLGCRVQGADRQTGGLDMCVCLVCVRACVRWRIQGIGG